MPGTISKKRKKARGARKKSLAASSAKNQRLHDVSVARATAPVTTAMDEPPRASLLGLPGELRNRIYRLVVISDAVVVISPEHHDQPSLLKTCHQVRHEAAKIFKMENKFRIYVRNLRPVVPHLSHWTFCDDTNVFYYFVDTDSQSSRMWSNLKAWLMSSLRGGLPPLLLANKPGSSYDARVVGKAFSLVATVGVPGDLAKWDTIDAILEIWKDTVAVAHPAFWQDESV